MTKISDTIGNMQNVIRRNKLGFSHLSALAFLHGGEGQYVSTIAKGLSVSSPQASQLINKLVHGGHLKRVNSTEDRRAVIVSITGKGNSILESLNNGAVTKSQPARSHKKTVAKKTTKTEPVTEKTADAVAA